MYVWDFPLLHSVPKACNNTSNKCFQRGYTKTLPQIQGSIFPMCLSTVIEKWDCFLLLAYSLKVDELLAYEVTTKGFWPIRL